MGDKRWHIDPYVTHWPDDETSLEETLRVMDDLVRQGKVRYIGAFNHPAWKLCRPLWVSDKHGLARYESPQPHYNLVHRAEFERELMDLCASQDVGVTPCSAQAGGFLTSKYRRGKLIPEGSRGQQSERTTATLTETNSFRTRCGRLRLSSRRRRNERSTR